MGVTVAVTRAACNTGAGTQTITTTKLGGLTPKAAICHLTFATTDDTVATEAVHSFGLTDGTTSGCIVSTSQDGNTSSNTWRGAIHGIAATKNVSTGAYNGLALFDSWTTNGFVIDWDNAVADAYFLTVTFFAGTSLDAYCGEWMLANNNSNQSTTDPGFEPDLLFTIFDGMAFTAGGTGASRNTVSLGIAGNSDSFAGGLTWWSEDVSPDQDPWVKADESGYLCRNMYGVGITYNSVKLVSFDASGFTVVNDFTASTPEFVYLALAFDGFDSFAGLVDFPASTGSNSITAVGFKPQWVLLIPTQFNDISLTSVSSAPSMAFALCMADDTNQYTDGVCEEDAAATMNTGSYSDDNFVTLIEDDGAGDFMAASLTSFDTNGWTWNATAVDSTTNEFFVLAIEEDTGGSPAYPLPAASTIYRRRRV